MTLGGYAAAIGTATVATGSSRVIARIDAAGAIDTSTSFASTVFSPIRSVVSSNGTDIWAAGTFGQGSRFVSSGFTFRTNHPNWVCGLVDRRIAPRAYAYLVVVEGEGTLAVLLTEGWQRANQLLAQASAIGIAAAGDVHL